MSYATEDIAGTLKQARERKGLSQRELSARSGVRQYQISKFENGAIDLRVSSLVELARALDLELTLVPRKSVPAVKSIARSSEPKWPAATVLKEIERNLHVVKDLQSVYPELSELNKLQKSFQAFKNLQNIGRELETLKEIARPVLELQKLAKAHREIVDAAKIPAGQLQALRQAASAAQSLRNQLVHNIPDLSSLPRPAYSLDEDDDG